jgi:hypothetical protein
MDYLEELQQPISRIDANVKEIYETLYSISRVKYLLCHELTQEKVRNEVRSSDGFQKWSTKSITEMYDKDYCKTLDGGYSSPSNSTHGEHLALPVFFGCTEYVSIVNSFRERLLTPAQAGAGKTKLTLVKVLRFQLLS